MRHGYEPYKMQTSSDVLWLASTMSVFCTARGICWLSAHTPTPWHPEFATFASHRFGSTKSPASCALGSVRIPLNSIKSHCTRVGKTWFPALACHFPSLWLWLSTLTSLRFNTPLSKIEGVRSPPMGEEEPWVRLPETTWKALWKWKVLPVSCPPSYTSTGLWPLISLAGAYLWQSETPHFPHGLTSRQQFRFVELFHHIPLLFRNLGFQQKMPWLRL